MEKDHQTIVKCHNMENFSRYLRHLPTSLRNTKWDEYTCLDTCTPILLFVVLEPWFGGFSSKRSIAGWNLWNLAQLHYTGRKLGYIFITGPWCLFYCLPKKQNVCKGEWHWALSCIILVMLNILVVMLDIIDILWFTLFNKLAKLYCIIWKYSLMKRLSWTLGVIV